MIGPDLRGQIRVVRSLVAPYSRHRELTDDLEQAGHLGYTRAMQDSRYDPNLVPIETWAYRGASNAITAAYRAECRHRGRVRRARKRARGLRRYNGLDLLDRLAVREAVERLPATESNMVVAWFWLDIPPKEYARLRGLGEWADRRHRERAVAMLQELLKPQD